MSAQVRTRLVIAAGSSLLALVAGGCGSDGPTGPPGDAISTSTPAPATPSASTPATPATPATESPSSDPTAGPAGSAAATGDLIDLDGIQLNQPTGWQPPQMIGTGAGAVAPTQTYLMSIDVATAIDPGQTLTAFAERWRDAGLHEIDDKLADEVMIAGQAWFHLTGKTNQVQYTDEYGTTVGDQQFVISIDTKLSVDPAERQATIDSILASVVLEP